MEAVSLRNRARAIMTVIIRERIKNIARVMLYPNATWSQGQARGRIVCGSCCVFAVFLYLHERFCCV